MEGDGDLLAVLPVVPSRWYQFKYQMYFHSINGWVHGQVRVS